MQQFRSPGELLLGVMDGHGPFGHLVSTFLIQHLPAVLMQKVVAAAAGAVLQGNSSSQPWELQQQTGTHQGSGKRQSKQQQQQSMQQQQQHPEMLLGSQLPYVVIPDHRGEAGGPAGYATAAEGAKASVANSSKRAQARNGRAVSKHQVVAQPEHTACYSLQDSPSSSSRHADAAVAVPKAIVDKVPICQSLLTNVFAETDHMLTSSGINTLDSGSTALLCHVGPDRISTAWVGDSRAVLGRRVLEPKAWDLRLRQQQRSSSSSSAVTGGSSSSGSGSNEGGRWQAIPLSDDHKPERPDEQVRAVALLACSVLLAAVAPFRCGGLCIRQQSEPPYEPLISS
jgi:serine/threonine protein phosphatase PrpC